MNILCSLNDKQFLMQFSFRWRKILFKVIFLMLSDLSEVCFNFI